MRVTHHQSYSAPAIATKGAEHCLMLVGLHRFQSSKYAVSIMGPRGAMAILVSTKRKQVRWLVRRRLH
jgi:hypothetical protein